MPTHTARAIDVFLQTLVAYAGSDLHLTTGDIPRVRVDGVLRRTTDTEVLDSRTLTTLIHELLTEDQKRTWEKNLSLDFTHDAGELGRYRINAHFERSGPAAVLRLIPNGSVPSLQTLETPSLIRTIPSLTNGLVLFCGPTGAGKSTTLASVIKTINETQNRKIVILENPTEFAHPSERCSIVQRELGTSVPSFRAGIRDALRSDPDIIVIGELRDSSTMRHAISAAETGHLVLGTLHTASVKRAVERIVDAVPSHRRTDLRQQLASVLRVVVCQRLLPNEAAGKGRIAAYETLEVTLPVASMIANGQTEQIPDAMNNRSGQMQTLERALAELVHSQIIQTETAWNHANDRKLLASELKARNLTLPPPLQRSLASLLNP